MRDGEQDRYADGIDEAMAEELLRRDVETAERAVLRLIRVPLDIEAESEPRGARSGAGRVPARGVGRRAQAQGANSAAGGGGRALCWKPTRDEAGNRLKSENVASEGAAPRDRLRPRPYQLACMCSMTPCSAAASLAGSRRSPSRLRSSDGPISKRLPIR